MHRLTRLVAITTVAVALSASGLTGNASGAAPASQAEGAVVAGQDGQAPPPGEGGDAPAPGQSAAAPAASQGRAARFGTLEDAVRAGVVEQSLVDSLRAGGATVAVVTQEQRARPGRGSGTASGLRNAAPTLSAEEKRADDGRKIDRMRDRFSEKTPAAPTLTSTRSSWPSRPTHTRRCGHGLSHSRTGGQDQLW